MTADLPPPPTRTLSDIIDTAANAAGLGPLGSTLQNGVRPGPFKLRQMCHCLELLRTPPLRSQDGKGRDAVAYMRVFDPCSSAFWLISEWDPKTKEAFGWCELFEGGGELGYISLDELANVDGRMGIGLEIDTHWIPRTIREVRDIE